MKLKGKNVLVTGGSRGIGKSICIALADEGANIAFTYISQNDAANDTVAEIRNYGVDALSFQCDVRDRKTLKNITKEKGCRTPLYGVKSKCIINIVPHTRKHKDSIEIDKKCIKHR